MVKMMSRSYSELRLLKSLEARYKYLRLGGELGRTTFGFDRHINQRFYTSSQWKRIRDDVIVRDNGCDLGLEGYEIFDKIIIHHMNPMSLDDFKKGNSDILDPEFLVCTVLNTHNAIHYGDANVLQVKIMPRTKNDTCPWK